MTGRIFASLRSRPGARAWLVLLALTLMLGRAFPALAMPVTPASTAGAWEEHCGSGEQTPADEHRGQHQNGDHGCCAGAAHLCGLHCASPIATSAVDAAVQVPVAQSFPETSLSSRHRFVPPPLRPPRV